MGFFPIAFVEVEHELCNLAAEIAENLHRRELGEIERAELLARWVEMVDRRPDQSAQVAQIETSKREDGRGHRKPGGVSKAARDLGLPRDQVARAVKIASLTPEAKAAGRNAPQAVLLEAAKEETAERQGRSFTNSQKSHTFGSLP